MLFELFSEPGGLGLSSEPGGLGLSSDKLTHTHTHTQHNTHMHTSNILRHFLPKLP